MCTMHISALELLMPIHRCEVLQGPMEPFALLQIVDIKRRFHEILVDRGCRRTASDDVLGKTWS